MGTTITEALQAFGHDVEQAFILFQKCVTNGIAGCVCNIMMLIKPAWIDTLKGSSADETLKMVSSNRFNTKTPEAVLMLFFCAYRNVKAETLSIFSWSW